MPDETLCLFCEELTEPTEDARLPWLRLILCVHCRDRLAQLVGWVPTMPHFTRFRVGRFERQRSKYWHRGEERVEVLA